MAHKNAGREVPGEPHSAESAAVYAHALRQGGISADVAGIAGELGLSLVPPRSR